MDKLSLLAVFTVSLPEAALNIYIGFLLTNNKTYLYLNDRQNLLRMTLTVCLMVCASTLTRFMLQDLVLIVFCNIILYMFSIKLIYRITWNETFFAVVCFYGFLICIEALFISPYLQFVAGDFQKLHSDDALRFLFVVPERILQLVAIVSLWDAQRTFINIKDYAKPKYMLVMLIAILFIGEVSFLSLIIFNFHKMSVLMKLACSGGGCSFSAVNFLGFRLMNLLLNNVQEKYLKERWDLKKQVKNDFSAIYHLLEAGNIETAKKICRENLL